VASGDADFVLALGVEKMIYPDKAKMLALFETGWDVHRAQENYTQLLELGQGIMAPPTFSRDAPFSRFMEVYAAFCRFHMREFGMSQRQLAVVAAKNHEHSQWNPWAQYRRPFTVEEVLASAPVCYPLTTLMCAPMTDGAAAVIVCSERAAARHGLTKRSARIRASIIRSASLRATADLHGHITRLAALEAYEKAAIGPHEVHVAEVHDASAMGEILQTENLGFCKRGDGGAFAESGASRLGGRLPINPSGGLECKGHPIGATGLAQVFELVGQLRGEADARQVPNARIAVQENGGGLFGVEEAAAHIAVLSAD
jgi:acetyl-CoA acetyltransferase